MRIEREMAIAFTVIGIAGGLSIFSLPFREQVPPAETIPEHEVTLDEAIEEHEAIIRRNTAYLDGLLERAAMEPTTETVPETSGASETSGSSETEETEETTYEQVEIYQPVDSLMAPDLQAWVYAYATMQQVDPYVVMAICERESACTSNILGDSGRAYGMMQIQPVWIQDKLAAHGYTESDLLMAEPNITIGIEILQDFLGKGRGIEWALTAYRYGPQQANACSTSDYSAWILSRADELRRQYEQR